MLYKIKPLMWEQRNDTTRGFPDTHQASTPFGTYIIERVGVAWWRWVFSLDNLYEDEYTDANTLADAQRDANQHWQDRIAEALEEVKEAQK